jgi:putative ABC transport system permease protein
MLGVRWYKVLYDLWGNKTRTTLIVLSITVGLFAIGMIVNARVILSEELARGYAAINPSSGTIRTIETFDEDLVRSVRQMRDVEEVDARADIGMRFQVIKNGTQENTASAQSDTVRWRDIQLFAVLDYSNMRVNKIRPQSGDWPPPPHELLLERSALELVGAQVGDSILIETADRKLRELRLAGTVHDLCQVPSQFDNLPRGYISFDTLEWLGEPHALNELHIIVRNQTDKREVLRVINQIKDKLEKGGFTIPLGTGAEPGSVPLDDILQAVLLLLGALGFLSLFLSAFLIINTISALVTQQIRQIGIMKAIGARAGQVVGMYLALIFIYGLVALFIAVPSGAIGARALSGFMAGLFNFDLTSFRIAPQAIGLQIAIGLAVPTLTALYPVLGVMRITAAEAMSDYGTSKDQFGAGKLDRLLMGRPALALRILPRPLMLSLRNTFRRKGRLALTLITLTLGGAIFISVFIVRSSLARTLSDLTQTYQSDVWLNFANPQRVERVERQALEVSGVARAKSWARMRVRRVHTDGSEGEGLVLYAPPVESDLIRPTILEGRWLLPEDHRALVLSTGALEQEPDVKVGDEIVLKVEGRKATFHVVGTALGLGLAPFIYANYDDIARVTHQTGRTNVIAVVTEQHAPSAQAQAAAKLEAHFRQAGARVNSVQLVSEENAGAEMGFNVVIVLALVMAFLLAIVGGLGLMGTLSINVLERTREIGVMRAIGAADGSVARVFIVEGVAIGAISWLLGTLLAIPLGGLLSDAVGAAFLKAPLSHVFSMEGVLLWLVVVIVLSGLASFLPARSASRLTVRQVLAYE